MDLFMVRVIFKSRGGLLTILINRKCYSYEIGFEYILYFEELLKRNKGQALSYLKKKCTNYWEGGPDAQHRTRNHYVDQGASATV